MNKSANIATTRHRDVKRATASLLATLTVLGVSMLFERRSHAQADQQQHDLLRQSQAAVNRKNSGCVSCHTSTDEPSMHPTGTVRLACIDCHGGDSTATLPPRTNSKTTEYEQIKNRAHVLPNDPALA